jgi:ribose 5-phosphate isomerase RpiB
MPTPVAIGSDEAGFALKALIMDVIRAEGWDVVDFGCHTSG